jgi:hypothetical protein
MSNHSLRYEGGASRQAEIGRCLGGGAWGEAQQTATGACPLLFAAPLRPVLEQTFNNLKNLEYPYCEELLRNF